MTHLLGIPLELLPLMLIGLSLVAAAVIFTLPEDARRTRTSVNLAAAVAKVLILAAIAPLVLDVDLPAWRSEMLPGIELVLRIDTLSLMFAMLSSVLWLVTTVYAVGYLEGKPNRSRFFGFFSLCVTATVGISFAGNLITFLLFYEMLTLVTYPLVAHYGTTASLKAARLYLGYSVAGGFAMLVAIAWLTVLVGPVEFTAGGAAEVAELAAAQPGTAAAIVLLLVAGLGVKAALVPFHSWLPRAMVAPAPVSALLHAVAVVKAGVFGITRVLEDVVGPGVAHEIGVLAPILVAAAVTIIYGSLRALMQDELKPRLAYSTVSQVSYVTLGLALATTAGITGGVVHLVHQGLMKITLFFCAGLFAEEIGATKVSQLDGVGRRMPLTAAAFTVGAFGMIGLPPLAGFVSKWYLGLGALEADQGWVVGVLLVSTLLNAMYFLPIVHRMWFRHAGATVADAPGRGAEPGGAADARGTEDEAGADAPGRAVRLEAPGRGIRLEAPPALLVPALVTAALAVIAGLLAGAGYSPLSIAAAIAERVGTR